MAELKFILTISFVFLILCVFIRIFYLKFGFLDFATGKKKITLKDFFNLYKH